MLPISFRLSAIQHEFWNMGHAIGFAFLFALLPRAYLYFDKLTAINYYRIALVSALVIAVATESIQQFIPGRSISYVDMYLDVVGAFMGCTLHYLLKGSERIFYGFLMVLSMVGLLYPSHVIFIDEYVKKIQFPVLSNFTYKSELRRWDGDSDKVLCGGHKFINASIPEKLEHKYQYEKFASTPRNSVIFSNALFPSNSDTECGLVIPITEKKYSGMFLRYMSSNWSGYSTLSIKLYAEEASPLTFRVNDIEHGFSFDYHDRFSQIVMIQPGVNTIEFALEDIKNAPKTRNMNMQEISSIGIVSTAPHILKSYVVFSVELK